MNFIKTLGTILVFGLVCTVSPAQINTWQWSEGLINCNQSDVKCVATDAAGNCYVSGNFYSSLVWDAFSINSIGFINVFTGKIDAAGNLLWLQSAGSNTLIDYPEGLCADIYGNVYVVGYFQGDSLVAGSQTVYGTGGAEIFVIKYNSSGNIVWLKSIGASGVETATDIACDLSGNLYVTGSFTDSLLVIGTETLINNGMWDGFVAKMDSSGNHLWTRSFGGTGDDRVNGVALSSTGDLYVAGSFSSNSFDIGSGTLYNSGISWDIFIVKLDAVGNPVWYDAGGGNASDLVTDITVDNYGDPVMTGYTVSNTISFGGNTLSGSGIISTLTVKYTSTGNAAWVRGVITLGSPNTGKDVAVDNNNNIHISGYYDGYINFGQSSLMSYNFSQDALLLTYDSNGNEISAISEGGTADDSGNGIAINPNGDGYFGGNFNTGITLDTTTYVHPGKAGFVAKLAVIPSNVIDISDPETVVIFPNPATDQTLLTASIDLTGASIVLLNHHGQLVTGSVQITGRHIQLPKRALPSGMYFLKITNADGHCSLHKIILH